MVDILDEISQVDICIVMDTTGSMAAYIDKAKEEARAFAEEIAAKADLDIRYAIVEYRDHPPQDHTFVTRIYPFSDAEHFQNSLNGLQASGGGDMPEAVLDGLVDAAKLQWRPTADKLCFLIGDSPPHGEYSDVWKDGCPCKATPNGVVELFASQHIKLHVLSIAGFKATTKAFAEMAEAIPGGSIREVESPVVATRSFHSTVAVSGELVIASREYISGMSTASASVGRVATDAEVAETLGWTVDMATGTRTYLESRGIDPTKDIPKDPSSGSAV